MADNVSAVGAGLSGGYLPPVTPGSSQEVQIRALNDVINRLNTLLKTQVFSDGTTKRMIIGYQANGWGAGQDFGIKVSQAGVDVSSATDTQLVFKMDLATWYWYDPSSGKNIVQIGVLPDGTGGQAIAKAGFSVNDAF